MRFVEQLEVALSAGVVGLLCAAAAAGQPVTQDSDVFLNQDTLASFTVPASNYDGGPGPVQTRVLRQPTHGTLVETGFLTYEYTPNPGYKGVDWFRWAIHDGAQYSISNCRLRVNGKPKAFNSTTYTSENIEVRVTLSGADDGISTPHSTRVTQQPANGTLTPQASPRYYDYLPDPGFFGTDSFEWELDDGMATSDLATVTLRVNQQPVAHPQSFLVLPGLGLTNWLDYTDDGLPGPLSLEIGTAANGAVTLLDPAGRFEYVPDPGHSGPDQFMWRLFDGWKYSSWEKVSLFVQPARPTVQLGIAFPESSVGPGFDNDAFNEEQFSALNVSLFRRNLGDWSSIEAVDGVYEWSTVDSGLGWAVNNGFSMFLTIPAKAPGRDCDPAKQIGDICIPLDMNEFAAFADAFMEHLAELAASGPFPVHAIAFGNEWSSIEETEPDPVHPGLPQPLRNGPYPGTKEDYVAQLDIVYDAVQRHLPQIPVAVGGIGTFATQRYAFCKGYLELEEVTYRENYCSKPYATDVVATTDYVLQNAEYDVLDVHLYEWEHDWAAMLTAIVNEALPQDKALIPIVASEFGGPRALVAGGAHPETYQAQELDSYIDTLIQLPVAEALFFRMVELGDAGAPDAYRYSGLIDRDSYQQLIQFGTPIVEKQTYGVFQGHAAALNP